ncbi:MAG: AI-2E family transporter, partial [Candidatus Kapabacteria bacterium]|nr:AI-2E family transporter [Candidatus Kapabacteria bacterium]
MTFCECLWNRTKGLGEKIGLHPIILLASLFVFSHFFGFWGLLIAVPVTAVLVMF